MVSQRLADRYSKFAAAEIPSDAGPMQRHETRRAFFHGAYQTLNLVKAAWQEPDVDACAAAIEAIYIEARSVADPPTREGFRYCKISTTPVAGPNGVIESAVSFTRLASYLFFLATGEPIPAKPSPQSPFIGESDSVGYYLIYSGKRDDPGNVLTDSVVATLPPYGGLRVVLADRCEADSELLNRENIVFTAVPWDGPPARLQVD